MWTIGTSAWSTLWSLLLAFLDCLSLPYRLASSKSQVKDSQDWMKADDFARLSCLISNRVARLEGEMTMLSSTCSLASKTLTVDPSSERIKRLEAELAETKKV